MVKNSNLLWFVEFCRIIKIIKGGEKMEIVKDLKKSRIFFIITAVCLIITIICICIETNMDDEVNHKIWKSDSMERYSAEIEYETTGNRTKLNEYEKEQEKISKLEHTRDTLFVVCIISWGITVALLITGVVLVIVEKKKK